MPPTLGQLLLLGLAGVLTALAWVLSVVRRGQDKPGLRVVAGWALVGGAVAALGVVVWHATTRGQWMPINDNFDALIWLATLLVLFVLYVQQARRLGPIDWFVLPVAVLLMIGAGLFGRIEYHDYVRSTWSIVHSGTAYAGAAAFTVAAASGAMYILTSRRLRQKQPIGPYFGSLERLEHLTMSAVILGFALLTIATITGGVRIIADGASTPLTKIILTVGMWLVYALVLHAPINPSFRGRKVAVLSMVGFVLMIGTVVAVQVLPGGTS